MEINIEKYDILTLDNDIRYVVASILNHKNIDYYLLVEEKNPKETVYEMTSPTLGMVAEPSATYKK